MTNKGMQIGLKRWNFLLNMILSQPLSVSRVTSFAIPTVLEISSKINFL